LKTKISILENKETKNVECASCKSYMFGLNILEKQLEDTTKKYLKNKNKRICRVWVEKGKPNSRNIKCNMYLLYAKGTHFK